MAYDNAAELARTCFREEDEALFTSLSRKEAPIMTTPPVTQAHIDELAAIAEQTGNEELKQVAAAAGGGDESAIAQIGKILETIAVRSGAQEPTKIRHTPPKQKTATVQTAEGSHQVTPDGERAE